KKLVKQIFIGTHFIWYTACCDGRTWTEGTQEAADPAAALRDGTPPVRRTGLRAGQRRRDRQGSRGVGADGLQLLPEQGRPRLQRARDLRAAAARGDPRAPARPDGDRRVRRVRPRAAWAPHRQGRRGRARTDRGDADDRRQPGPTRTRAADPGPLHGYA